jgi:protoporphyrinogen IX oxidase
MLWLKSFHIIFLVTWFAGLFYLPRIFVYHAMSNDDAVRATFKVMERRLMAMTHLGGALTWVFGLATLLLMPGLLSAGWMQAKLALVLLLLAYHFWCALIVRELATDRVRHDHVWYRWFNEFPTLILIAVVILVVVKPF